MAYVELEDLKQLLETGFAQNEARMTEVIRREIAASEKRLRTEMQDGFTSVADIITGTTTVWTNGSGTTNGAPPPRKTYRLVC